ncbi:MAG: glycosyltransferase family 1 protein [Hyphomicrobiales bacterium]|nr:MAG: glycosyltransferase family 1 protein [Hyphomicrobiales bacterium]
MPGPNYYDIVFVADCRFSGGTSTALANEIEAAWSEGYRCGLIHVAGAVLRRPGNFHHKIRDAIDKGRIAWLDPAAAIDCGLVLVHHPMILADPLARPLRIRSDHAVLIAHHPPLDGLGHVEYDVRAQVSAIASSIGRAPEVAPVGPNVRAAFSKVPVDGVDIMPRDWNNLVDVSRWPCAQAARPGTPFVIGRHSRPDPLKWPDSAADILAAYPALSSFRVRILGAGAFLRQMLPEIPPNWECLPFGGEDPASFLASLNAYVYFHSARWIEAFGYGVLEALAAGLPTLLPASFQALFGEGALYCDAPDVAAMLANLASDLPAWRRQQQAARAVVHERFSTEQFGRRLRELYSLRPHRRARGVRPAPVKDRKQPHVVLFVSSNGVGLGHLTRQLAIARHLSSRIRPVFFTLSRAAALVRHFGYLVEHTSFHRYVQTSPERWNPFFARELREAIAFHEAEAVIFDGNVPYSGLIEAMRAIPKSGRIWIRRGMWREHHGGALDREANFASVIEPGELAGEDDDGPTRPARDKVVAVDPILLVSPAERFTRAAARETLGVEGARRLVAVQLGAGNNFDFAPVRAALIASLLRHDDVEVLEFESPIVEHPSATLSLGPRHRVVRVYPSYRCSTAFDGAFSAAGYNSFHENVLGAVPTIFIPNDAEEMDRQGTRAAWAARRGLAGVLNSRDMEGVDRAVDALLDPEAGRNMAARCRQLAGGDGARAAARFIEESLLSAR